MILPLRICPGCNGMIDQDEERIDHEGKIWHFDCLADAMGHNTPLRDWPEAYFWMSDEDFQHTHLMCGARHHVLEALRLLNALDDGKRHKSINNLLDAARLSIEEKIRTFGGKK